MNILDGNDYDGFANKTVRFGYFFSGLIIGIILTGTVSIILLVRSPRYNIDVYEGMTCINHQNGLTCNWDEWEKIE